MAVVALIIEAFIVLGHLSVDASSHASGRTDIRLSRFSVRFVFLGKAHLAQKYFFYHFEMLLHRLTCLKFEKKSTALLASC